jgi:transposase
MRVRGQKRYEPGFRQQAVELLERTDRGLKQVADSLGVPSATLRYWYDREMARRRGKPKPVAPATLPVPAPETVQQKLARLERENAALRREVDDLKLDKDILKKAAAFFAKESK